MHTWRRLNHLVHLLTHKYLVHCRPSVCFQNIWRYGLNVVRSKLFGDFLVRHYLLVVRWWCINGYLIDLRLHRSHIDWLGLDLHQFSDLRVNRGNIKFLAVDLEATPISSANESRFYLMKSAIWRGRFCGGVNISDGSEEIAKLLNEL